MTNEENQQELLFKFSMFERQITELQQQIEAVEKGIVELTTLDFGLDDLVGKKEQEIFAPIGKGIFVKAKLVSEELIVDIGQGNFIKKTIPKTKELIQEQIQKLRGIKTELEENLSQVGEELSKMMNNSQDQDCQCDGEECNCQDGCNCQKD